MVLGTRDGEKAMDKKNGTPCTICNGSGSIPNGAWSMPFDSSTCSHCNGTGLEPEKALVSTMSSPFEDEGMGIGIDDPDEVSTRVALDDDDNITGDEW